jgi:hypothetical protein
MIPCAETFARFNEKHHVADTRTKCVRALWRTVSGWPNCGLVQRFESRCDASSRGLICENTPHDEPAPAHTIKRISLLSSWAILLFFCYLGLHASNVELSEKVDNFFPWALLFFFWNWLQIGASVHELGHMAFCASCPQFRNDPIGRPAATHINCRWR